MKLLMKLRNLESQQSLTLETLFLQDRYSRLSVVVCTLQPLQVMVLYGPGVATTKELLAEKVQRMSHSRLVIALPRPLLTFLQETHTLLPIIPAKIVFSTGDAIG